jgi:hydroxypyruvate isomerase
VPNFSANLGFLWADRPLLYRVTAAANAHFRACEFHWPYEVAAKSLAQACREMNMTVLGINTPRGDVAKGEFGLAALPNRMSEFQDQFSAVLEYAREIGAQSIHVMAGKVAPADKIRARETFLENLAHASALAATSTIQLLLEPLNARDNARYFYSTLAEAIAIIDELSLPNLKLQFDVYHVAVAEGDVLIKLRRYLPRIGNVQIAGVPDRAEPDQGEINYRAIFDELDRLGYRGFVGCEYKPRGDTDAGLAWMRSAVAQCR